jgi:hypothetical protein
MNLSLSLILSEFEDMNPIFSIHSTEKIVISGLLFFTTDMLPLEKNFIYLCNNENIADILKEKTDIYFFISGKKSYLRKCLPMSSSFPANILH